METKEGILLKSQFINKMTVDGDLGWFQEETGPLADYKWNCIIDNSGVYELFETIMLYPSTIVRGDTGMIVWKFKALKKGKGMIRFELISPASKEPEKVINVTIEVD